MNSQNRTGRTRQDMIWLSGWVFADLLLGLMVLFLVSTRGSPAPPPIPTNTPTATFTATPTATGTATPTATSTSTATTASTVRNSGTRTRTAVAIPTGTPTVLVGLSQSPYLVTFRIDPDLVPALLTGSTNAQATARTQLLAQMHSCFDQRNAEAGVVLAFGANPIPGNGNRLAEEATQLLESDFENLFNKSVMRNFHTITGDPFANGSVDVEIYFLSRPGLPNPAEELGESCTPPPRWCVGNGSAQVYVSNWDKAGALNFTLNNQSYAVNLARGNNPSYRCILANPGTVSWRAENGGLGAQGQFGLTSGKPTYLYFCNQDGHLVSDCAGASKVP